MEISEDEALALMARPKFVKGGSWTPRVNHAGHVVWFAEVFDQEDITIPGVTVALEVKEAAPVDSCLHQLTLFLRRGQAKRRVYQLEVVPAQKRSHNGPEGSIYGPHEHVGECVTTPVEGGLVGCENWKASLELFSRRAGVTFLEPVESPC